MRNGGEQSVGHRNTSQLAAEASPAPAKSGMRRVGRRHSRSPCVCCALWALASVKISKSLSVSLAAEALFGKPHAERGVGADDRRHHDCRIGGEARRPLLDMMAEPGQQRRDVANRRGDLGIDGIAIGRLVGKGDAEPAGIAADLLRERPLRRRRDIGARCLRAANRVQHDRAVAHADAHDMTAGKAAPAFAAIGPERIARAGRLQSEHAGCRSGNADRTAAVAGMRHGKDARGDRRGRAAGRTSGGMRQIPRVAGRAEQAALGGRQQAELRAGALAEDRHPGVEEALREGAGMIGHIVLVDARARRWCGYPPEGRDP